MEFKLNQVTQRKIENTILSIDFDDTVTIAGPFPTIKSLQIGAKQALELLDALGFTIIINTCRMGESQEQVKTYLQEQEVPFHYINENHPAIIERFGFDCRKIYGDFMIDDKCLFFRTTNSEIMPWADIVKKLLEQVCKESYEPLLQKLEKLQNVC